MTPTNRLRFVEREITISRTDTAQYNTVSKVRVLQQWFRQDRPCGQQIGNEGEWRDVPLEVEE